MSAVHVYEVLAKTFSREGVDTCFALLGDANMHWAAAMESNGCSFTYVKDEHCALAAAMAWARFTGEVGVATETCGPGLTQILTALPAAVRANIPMVIFAGEAPVNKPWYNQAIDQCPFVEACGATYESLHHAESMPVKVRDAFLEARKKLCPVVIGIPFDLQESVWDGPVNYPEVSRKLHSHTIALQPSDDKLQCAVELITKAKRISFSQGHKASNDHMRADTKLGVEALNQAFSGEKLKRSWRSPQLALMGLRYTNYVQWDYPMPVLCSVAASFQ